MSTKTDGLEGTAKALADLEVAIRARSPMLAIETSEESRVLTAIQNLAAKPTVRLDGEVDVESRRVFKWTCSRGIVRLDTVKCPRCGTEMSQIAGTNGNIYKCERRRISNSTVGCDHEQPTEFPEPTFQPNMAIQDFLNFARADNTELGHIDHASILVLCDIHRFILPIEAAGKSDEQTLRSLRDAAAELPPTKSTLVLLAPYLGDLGDSKREVHRIEWPLPTTSELILLVRMVMTKMEPKGIEISMGDKHVDACAQALSGLTMDEAKRLLGHTLVKTKRLNGKTAADLGMAKAEILRESTGLELITPLETLDDIGGLENLKATMANLPNYLTEEAKRLRVEVPRAFLLAGPPGTGKSLAAKVMGSGVLPEFRWDLSGQKSKWYGETESRTAEVLRSADALNDVIVWLDEGEKQTGEGGDGSSHEVTEGVMAQLLTWLEETRSNAMVVITVNHPDRLRDELVSRLDQQWFVDYPDEDAAYAILKIHTAKRDVILTHDQLQSLASLCVGNVLSGREIEQCVKQAIRQAFDDGARRATVDDLAEVLRKTQGVATQPKRQERIEAMRRECGTFQPAGRPAPRMAPDTERRLPASSDSTFDVEL